MNIRQLTWRILGGMGAVSVALSLACAQDHTTQHALSEVQVHITPEQPGNQSAVPAIVWLDPIGAPAIPFPPDRHYTLQQKNRMFVPHLQVIPLGSSVQFPNADPFFHNVFSLFDGKRFDLGLYEAGSSRSVIFSREGVSYIFCNIHPEMSAIVISIPTNLYGVADTTHTIAIHNVPPGDYKMQTWVEGVPQSFLEHLTRTIHVGSGKTDLGNLKVPIQNSHSTHTNKFGHTYDREPQSSY